jgi:hypothetical protein
MLMSFLQISYELLTNFLKIGYGNSYIERKFVNILEI